MPTKPTFKEPMLVDSSAVRELFDQIMFQKVWRYYEPSVRHSVCGVICFEMYQSQKTMRRNTVLYDFDEWLRAKRLKYVCRDEWAARTAAKLSLAVQRDIDNGLKDTTELKRLNNDILIAGLAISQNLTVFTEDKKDWNYLRQVVHRNIGDFPNQLRVAFKSDLMAGS